MIRFIFMAALFGALGAGGASVDWRDQWDHVQGGWDGAVELWNAPGPVDVEEFGYWRQCDSCYNLWHGDRSCCSSCGNDQFTSNVRARKIEQHREGWYRGYQTADGLLYIHKKHVVWFNDQFIVGSDIYQKSEAIIAGDAKLRK